MKRKVIITWSWAGRLVRWRNGIVPDIRCHEMSFSAIFSGLGFWNGNWSGAEIFPLFLRSLVFKDSNILALSRFSYVTHPQILRRFRNWRPSSSDFFHLFSCGDFLKSRCCLWFIDSRRETVSRKGPQPSLFMLLWLWSLFLMLLLQPFRPR